jgi:L-seryl-tRNA(Ser) seleniumtransferase
VRGFVHSASPADLVALGRAHGLPVVDDLGSGSMLDTTAFGLAHEPMVQESVAAGMSLVCFSGDKLLGGPQAGIIVGDAALVGRLKRHPLTRAVRPDKLTIAALVATLDHYLRDEALDTIPIWRMIAAPLDTLAARAEHVAATVRARDLPTEVVPGESAVGGGSLPGETLLTHLVALRVADETALAERLRRGNPPVIGRLERNRLLLDLRTVLPEDDTLLLAALDAALSEPADEARADTTPSAVVPAGPTAPRTVGEVGDGLPVPSASP